MGRIAVMLYSLGTWALRKRQEVVLQVEDGKMLSVSLGETRIYRIQTEGVLMPERPDWGDMDMSSGRTVNILGAGR